MHFTLIDLGLEPQPLTRHQRLVTGEQMSVAKKKKKTLLEGRARESIGEWKDLFIYLPVYLFSLLLPCRLRVGHGITVAPLPHPSLLRGDGRMRKICEPGCLSEGGRVEAAWCRRSQNTVCLKKKPCREDKICAERSSYKGESQVFLKLLFFNLHSFCQLSSLYIS